MVAKQILAMVFVIYLSACFGLQYGLVTVPGRVLRCAERYRLQSLEACRDHLARPTPTLFAKSKYSHKSQNTKLVLEMEAK